MNNLTIIALVQMLISLVIAISIVYLLINYVNRFMLRKYKLEKMNTAYSIFLGGLLFTFGYIISAVVPAVISATRLVSGSYAATGEITLHTLKYALIFIATGMVVSTIITFLTVQVFNAFTKDKDELQEIANDNIGIAIVTTVVLIVISLFIREGFTLLLESMLPYPEVPKVF